jgi:RND superfamily putative drug exporter
VLLPTLLRVFGRHAWARPGWLARILPEISFGHGH